ncbi:MAG: IS66 family transposase, partial [Gammaproteobacteria bacterium]
MSPTKPPLTPDQLAALPPDAQKLVLGIVAYYEARLAAMEARVAELEGKLAAATKTPQNSSLPPSTQHPHAKPAAAKPKSKKKRGGQPGHSKHERAFIPAEQCQKVVACRPSACRRCGVDLTGSDPEPLRHQVWEIREIKPLVTEYQLHRLMCPRCCDTTCGQLPAGVPRSQAGPNLIALVATLMGCFRQSKRRVALFLNIVLNQPCSPGWVVKLQNQATAALTPAYDELVRQLPGEAVLGLDESPTKQGNKTAWLWAAIALHFTVFTLRTTRAATVVKGLLTDAFQGVVNCDRAKMYWQVGRLQWCWAHLKRDFQALIDHPDRQVQRLG